MSVKVEPAPAGVFPPLRYEVLPFARALKEAERLDGPERLTVTSSPKHGSDHMVDMTLQLAALGHTVTPHLAARSVASADHLDEILERLAGAGTRDVFVVGGDGAEVAGPYDSAGALLEALSAHPLRPAMIGIAGYPEGHPLISTQELEASLRSKAEVADYIVTQLCSDVGALTSWLDGIRTGGVTLPLYVGAAGPVERRRLIEISLRIGVGPSLRYLRKQRGVTRLFRRSSDSASSFARGASGALADPALNVAGFHVFTFNELVSSVDWAQGLRAASTA
jgi:methylenetetrahydrofolate reductase (NADPH)